MKTVSERILFYMSERDVSYSHLSKLTGITKSSLQRYATGTTNKIPIDAIAKIEQALHLEKGTLMGWERKEALVHPAILPISKRRFRVLGNVACGKPIYANEEYETFIEANTDIKADFCLIAKGDSMINARIFDGDVVFIKEQQDVENGEIAAVIIGDEVTLKRVYKYPNRLELRPENPVHNVQNYEGEELSQIKILGKAVAFQSYIK